MTAEETRSWILDGLRSGHRRIFVKFGDGEYIAMHGKNKGWHTINGDHYTDEVQSALHNALVKLAKHPDAVIAKWPDSEPWADLRQMHADHLHPRWADYTSLLLQRGNERQMFKFWDAVRNLCDIDYVAPACMAPMARWLNARHIVIPDDNAHPIDTTPGEYTAKLVIVGAGFAAKPLIAALSDGDQHLLDVGSGFDILCRGTTRQDQPDEQHIRNIFGL